MARKFAARLRALDGFRIFRRLAGLASRGRPLGLPAAFAAVSSFVVLLIHREVYSFVTQSPSYKVPAIRMAVRPSWIPEEYAESVQVETQGLPIYDPGLVERVGRAFESCPWVRRVTSVERALPDRVRVRFEYRRPHATVRRPSGYVLVDPEGVRLPGVYPEPPACGRGPCLAGVTSRPSEPGRPWKDPSLEAGLEMLDFVRRNPILQRLDVQEINLCNLGGRLDPRRSEVTLRTRRDCDILWGSPLSSRRFGEPSPEEKLENLGDVLALYPGLEGLRSVKVYFQGSKAVEAAVPGFVGSSRVPR